MPTSELENKATPEFCGSLGTGCSLAGTGHFSRKKKEKEKEKEMSTIILLHQCEVGLLSLPRYPILFNY